MAATTGTESKAVLLLVKQQLEPGAMLLGLVKKPHSFPMKDSFGDRLVGGWPRAPGSKAQPAASTFGEADPKLPQN